MQQIFLAFLRQAAVALIACQITETGPFHNQSANRGDAVRCGAGFARWSEKEVIIWHSAGGVEGDFEVVGQMLSLLEDVLDRCCVVRFALERAGQKIVS